MTTSPKYILTVIPAKAGIQEGRSVDYRFLGSDVRLVQTILGFLAALGMTASRGLVNGAVR